MPVAESSGLGGMQVMHQHVLHGGRWWQGPDRRRVGTSLHDTSLEPTDETRLAGLWGHVHMLFVVTAAYHGPEPGHTQPHDMSASLSNAVPGLQLNDLLAHLAIHLSLLGV